MGHVGAGKGLGLTQYLLAFGPRIPELLIILSHAWTLKKNHSCLPALRSLQLLKVRLFYYFGLFDIHVYHVENVADSATGRGVLGQLLLVVGVSPGESVFLPILRVLAAYLYLHVAVLSHSYLTVCSGRCPEGRLSWLVVDFSVVQLIRSADDKILLQNKSNLLATRAVRTMDVGILTGCE